MKFGDVLTLFVLVIGIGLIAFLITGLALDEQRIRQRNRRRMERLEEEAGKPPPPDPDEVERLQLRKMLEAQQRKKGKRG